MSVSRDVILDLLPVYLAGEASPATRQLVEEYLQQDPELAESISAQATKGLGRVARSTATPPPDVELRSLQRVRAMIAWQRRLFGFGIGFTAIALTTKITFRNGGVADVRFLIRDFPAQFAPFAVLAICCWIAYFVLRHRLGTAKPPRD